MGQPWQVSEGVHYHWFPGLMQMPTGEVIVTMTIEERPEGV